MYMGRSRWGVPCRGQPRTAPAVKSVSLGRTKTTDIDVRLACVPTVVGFVQGKGGALLDECGAQSVRYRYRVSFSLLGSFALKARPRSEPMQWIGGAETGGYSRRG